MASTDLVRPFTDGLDYPMFVVTAADLATGLHGGCLVGFATQCSIEPARFLVCLSKNNQTYRVARRSPSLAVHALGEGHLALATLFGEASGDDADKFRRCAWEPGPHGTPLLSACPRRIVGDVVERIDLGDHVGFVVAPFEASGDGAPPLMFSAVRNLDAGHPA